jgi:uroporphyrinogen-III synthase
MARHRILSTKKLNGPVVMAASRYGIELFEQEYISVTHLQNITHPQAAAVIFTSQHAALAAENAPAKKWKRIYCLEGATLEAVRKFDAGKAEMIVAADAEQLARSIIERKEKELVFYCGDQRRDTVPSMLAAKNIIVREVIVYKTIETPQQAPERLDAVLFFSPSGVRSFFTNNSLPGKAVLFAIGHTTAGELGKFSANRIVTSGKPSQEGMLQAVKGFFQLSIEI